MFLITVLSAAILFHSVEGGYDYSKPSVTFELPHSQTNLQNQGFEEHQKISYSVPYEDYYYLHQQKHGNSIQHNAIQTGGAAHAQHSAHVNSVQHVSHSLAQPIAIPPQHTFSRAEISQINSLRSAANQGLIIHEQNLGQSANPQNSVPLAPHAHYVHNIQNSFPNTQKIATQTLSGHNNVPNLVNVQSSVQPTLNLQVQNIPAAVNLQNYVPQSLSVQSSDSHVATVQYNQPHLLNIQQNGPQFLNDQNTIPPIFSVQNSDAPISNVQNNQLPLQNRAPQLLNVQNNLSPASNLQGFGPQIINLQNDPAPLINIQNNDAQPLNVQNIVEPVITKHIYFHVPPSEVEEIPVVRPPPPPKKVYKIVFIKVPAQHNSNNDLLQQAAANRLAQIEDKTLIYVLVKKPEPTKVIIPQPKPSEHEVLFVKYRGDANAAAEELAGAIAESNSPSDSTQILEPRLRNNKL